MRKWLRRNVRNLSEILFPAPRWWREYRLHGVTWCARPGGETERFCLAHGARLLRLEYPAPSSENDNG